MSSRIVRHLTVIAGVAGLGITANALPLQWSGNGHWYNIVEAPGISWVEAMAAVPAGWHLATLTSEDENEWVYENIVLPNFGNDASAGVQAWLGGYTTEPNQSTTDPMAWAWVTGEAWAWTNWGPGEPNGDSTGLTINRYGDWSWNDEGAWPAGIKGYVLEKSVPDGGATLALLGLSMAAVGFATRRRA